MCFAKTGKGIVRYSAALYDRSQDSENSHINEEDMKTEERKRSIDCELLDLTRQMDGLESGVRIIEFPVFSQNVIIMYPDR